MPADTLRENGEIIRVLQGAITEGEHGLKVVPGLLKRVIRENRWQERHVEVLGRNAAFAEFTRFVEEKPPEGLGASVALLKLISRGDAEAIDLIDGATQTPRGRPIKNNNVTNLSGEGVGNSAQQAIRRLRKDRPDLHARVIAGELSPHAAMIEAGFRHPTAAVRTDDVHLAVGVLLKHFSADQIVDAVIRTAGEGKPCRESRSRDESVGPIASEGQ